MCSSSSHEAKGYNVTLCQGGYLRAYEDSDSLMLVIRNKKSEKTEMLK